MYNARYIERWFCVKEEICYHALRLFDENGYHGTSMRAIGEAVGCTMPTLYHHYGNKKNLFDEVVRVAYINSIDDLQHQLPAQATPQEVCAESIIQKKNLSENNLLIHRLAMKTWLGCEGYKEVRHKLVDWEKARNKKNEAMLSITVSSTVWVKIITRAFFNMTERIILLSESIPDEDIREEMRLLFEAANIIN